MARMIKKRSKKAGLPPGTLIHIGVQRAEAPKITVIDYDEAVFQEKELKTVEECFSYKDKPTTTWINIDGLHQKDVLEKLSDCFGLHPLVMEDIMNTDQRPKMEDYTDYLYIVLKMLYYNDEENRITTEQVSLIIAPHTVISFQEGLEGDVFGPLRERLRNDKGRIRKMGADYLAYSLIDAIVDSYFTIVEKLGERIELLEEELISDPDTKTLHEIHYLKREMIFLRKAVWPLRELINMLMRGESPLIHESMKIYFRDVYDHTIQVIDTVETLRDMVTGMLDIYLSSVSNRLNAVMKVLTIIATIFIPLTFIVGVYGMNFRYMPELEWRYGYPLIWFIMIAIGVTMLIFFKKRNWL
jgi:magnesium transporter